MADFSFPYLLSFFITIPAIGFVFSLFIPRRMEHSISMTALAVIGAHLLLTWGFLGYWALEGFPTLQTKEAVLFNTIGFQFYISLYFDKITAVYLAVGSYLTFLVTIYCRYYMHRESGYKRFFSTILFFYVGYNHIILAGNFETLFIGWEILGLSSFLLIGFYRDRYLPAKNALKVFAIFRVADMALVLVMWMGHHLWHDNIGFSKLADSEAVIEHIQSHPWLGMLISLMILLAAAVKSAQYPFTSWMPRAMEGPTPSSAIFYGSLSSHLGAFLLIRTYNFWAHQIFMVSLIALMGLVTCVVATVVARVQSSVKTQIAYSSAAQIGIIFVEISLGFYDLALIHFAGNAFLRTYQLLVSPSVVSYLIREQFYNFVPRHYIDSNDTLRKLEYTLYIWSLKEFNMDRLVYNLIWSPLEWIGFRFNFVTGKVNVILAILPFFAGLFILVNKDMVPEMLREYIPPFFAFIGWTMVLKSFAEQRDARLSWFLIMLNHSWIVLAVSLYDQVTFVELAYYMSGVIVSGIIGYLCLQRLESLEHNVNVMRHQGHAYEHPKIAFVFFLCCLGIMAFPISPTFIGVDLIFNHIRTTETYLVFMLAMSFITVGFSVIKIYSYVFLGTHVKTYHPVPNRSS